MTADLWRPLTARFNALGHPYREAECMAAGILAGSLVILMIIGYLFSDAEREPVLCSMPAHPRRGHGRLLRNCPGECGPGRYPFTLPAGTGAAGRPRGSQRKSGWAP